MEVIERLTLTEVRASGAAKIFYSPLTCWWTHDPAHLSQLPGGIPCGPRGEVLFETDDVRGFLDMAEAQPEHYGRYGLRAFMAAHHLNCVVSLDDRRSWSAETWDEYNDALDRLKQRVKEAES